MESDNQFSRTEMLLGKEAIDKLSNSHVIIFGIGGVGGYVLEALVRTGLGNIDLVDSDKICLTNLNRQIIALHSSLDEYKVDVAKKRALDINPNININNYRLFYTSEMKDKFNFSKYDYVIDAIDTVSSKISLIEECKKSNTKIICAMGAGNKINPLMFEVADISKTSVCPLARVIRQELKKRNIKDVKVVYSKEQPKKSFIVEDRNAPASNAFCPSAMGLIIASEVIKDLIN